MEEEGEEEEEEEGEEGEESDYRHRFCVAPNFAFPVEGGGDGTESAVHPSDLPPLPQPDHPAARFVVASHITTSSKWELLQPRDAPGAWPDGE